MAMWGLVLSQGMAVEFVVKIMSMIGLVDFLLIFLMLVPVVAVFAAVLLSLSIYARSFKEAQSYGDLAEAIIAMAEETGILIHEDPYLSEVLATLDVGQDIPESLYYVIAELLAYSYVLQGKIPPGWEGIIKRVDFEV